MSIPFILLSYNHYVKLVLKEKPKNCYLTYISVAVTAKKHFFLLWWKTLIKLPLLLKWLKHVLEHLNLYVITFLPCKTPLSPAQGSKSKQVEKYTIRFVRTTTPSHIIGLIWKLLLLSRRHKNQTYNEYTSSQVLRNEWQTGTFPFQAKSKTLKKGTIIAYHKNELFLLTGCLCCCLTC